MLFSILIPTLDERRAQFEALRAKLQAQIARAGLREGVEILELCDNRETSLGAKRNALIARAQGDYIAFVDDDDDVSNDYVPRIYNTLREHPEADCLGITGIVLFQRVRPRRFVYSLAYDHYFSRKGVYYRPPYILNPVRRAIALQFPYAAVSFNEDIDWAMRVARARVLKREVMLPEVLYYYYSRRHWFTQDVIDFTEPVRHPLGLQLANRLRVARWLKMTKQHDD
jgi:glycosyltransferase involved in cell wall biosynthesis